MQLLVYGLFIATVRTLFDWRAHAPRLLYGRALFAAGSLMAWVWAPYVSLLMQLPLRAPVVVVLVRVVRNRLVRFVPTRA